MAKRRRHTSQPSRRTKRRVGRKKRSGRSGALRGYTTQSGIGGANNFRSRRIRAKAYRKILWNDGLLKTHYRSIAASSTVTGTPNTVVDSTFQLLKGLTNGAGQFWEVAGGALPVDGGVAVPTFGQSITVRGGMARITLTTNSTDDGVRVRVWAVWSNERPSMPVSGTVPLDWDPSVLPSFQRNVGRILMSREALLLPGSNGLTLTYRLRPQRIDKEVFQNDGNSLFWFYTVMQTSNNDIGPLAEAVTVVRSFNLSFTGDEVV